MHKSGDLIFSSKSEGQNSNKHLNLQFNILNSWIIEAIRIGVYFFAVATSIVSQLLNPYFINFNIWVPVYSLVILGLVLHFFIVFNFQNLRKIIFFELSIFIFDAVFISAISYFTFLSYPIFTVLYLVNIVLCSFVLGSSISFLMAGVSTFFYALTFLLRISEVSFDPITFILNVIVFYFAALFSGHLGDLLLSKSKELSQTTSDLKDLKNLSQIIIKNIGVGLVSFQKDKQISFANESAKKILGQSLDSEDQFIKNKIIVSDNNQISEDFSNNQGNTLAQNHTYTQRQEVELELKGIKKNLEFITTYIPDEQMQTRWILLVQDLTEIKGLQKELQMKEKLAAIGQLAGGIAHEIRNPLASISGSVEMLKESTLDLNPENSKLFSIIIKEIDRLNLLITDFLSFVRPEVKKTDQVHLKDLINDIIILVKHDKKLSENVIFNLELSDVKIRCDQSKLQQAFINIITNSLQAIQKSNQPTLTCRISKEGFFVSLEFTDNGPGIPSNVIGRIFEPFYTTKEKGTGLGLAITHRIIEGHEGTIKVYSDDKKGTTFFIRLPIN